MNTIKIESLNIKTMSNESLEVAIQALLEKYEFLGYRLLNISTREDTLLLIFNLS